MKQIKRSSIILGLVSIAFLLKAIQNHNLMMGLTAFLLLVIMSSRMLLIKKVIQEDTGDYTNTDFIHRYLQSKACYALMYKVYKAGNCTVLYEENDGILLYDHTSKTYYASALCLEAARDIARCIPQDYEVFVVCEDIFEQIENKEFPVHKKEKEDIIYYYSK